jgi:hypothetical protein
VKKKEGISPELNSVYFYRKEEFEDTKGVIRIGISNKNRQHNGQKKKYKMTNNDLQNIHIKLKIENNKWTNYFQVWVEL